MKCPKKNGDCKISLIIKGKADNYICSGINSKPTKYHKDIIQLCLNGFFSKRSIEMTIEEANYISACLNTSIGQEISR